MRVCLSIPEPLRWHIARHSSLVISRFRPGTPAHSLISTVLVCLPRFDVKKGYGFITGVDGVEVFVHQSQVPLTVSCRLIEIALSCVALLACVLVACGIWRGVPACSLLCLIALGAVAADLVMRSLLNPASARTSGD